MDPDEDVSGRHEVANGSVQDEEAVVPLGHGEEPGGVDGLDGTSAVGPHLHDRRRARERLRRPRERRRGRPVGVAVRSEDGCPAGQHLFPGPFDQSRHSHRPQGVGEPVEVDEQQHDAQGDREAGHGDPEVGYKAGLDPAEQGERVGEGADEGPRTAFRSRSRYHSCMNRGQSVPVACWTTRTPTVTTNPSRAIIAPTITESALLAVVAE